MISTFARLCLPVLCLISACSTTPDKLDQESDSTCPIGSEGCPCTEGGTCDEHLVCLSKHCVEKEINTPVDLLIVMDNSFTMARHAARVGYDIQALVDQLVQAGVHLRIGVTTTDMGNISCADTLPEAGELRLSSCRSRLEDFVFHPGTPNETDAQSAGCTNACKLNALVTTPTKTHLDAEIRSRKWVEVSPTTSNLPEEISLADALACMIPQGINGCGFEAPLESIHAALTQTKNPASQNFGFLRPDAQSVVLVVTDEFDCSAANMQIFSDNKTFWVDPKFGPRSSICWLAGVRCNGDGTPYDDCIVENFASDGRAGVADNLAVMHPMSRYLHAIESVDGMLFALTGVPRGFGFGETELRYFEPQIFEDKRDWGIAPGCTQPESPGEWALPPVRLRDLATKLGNEQNLFSICRSSHHETMQEIASRVIEGLQAR